MKKYQTIIRVVANGIDEFDAAERAGELIDISRMEDDTMVSCGCTKALDCQEEQKYLLSKAENIINQLNQRSSFKYSLCPEEN